MEQQVTSSEMMSKSEPSRCRHLGPWGGVEVRADWPMVGRDEEIASITRALGEAGPARGVVITGPAGTGRTRLAREAARIAAERDRPVRWATATPATQTIPFGAMSHLLPFGAVSHLLRPGQASMDQFGLLQHAVWALSGAEDDERPVLAVDDVHLLDDLSAALVHELAVGGTATVVLTVPTDDISASVKALFKDGLAIRLDVGELSREEVDRVVGAALDGDLDARASERLWRLTRGNPQFLRGLVEGGLYTGALRCRDGLWSWDGEMAPSPSLVDLVLDRLGDTDPEQRLLLNVLATAEQMRAAHLITLCSRAVLATLERRGLVALEHGLARLAHPLYAAAIRDRMPESEARWLRAEAVRLAGTDGGNPSGDQLMRLSELGLDSDAVPPRAEQLARAAEQANAQFDHAAAERLARAAVASGGGDDARFPLIEALQWQGRVVEVEELAAAAVVDTERGRTRLGVLRAVNLFCGLSRPREAERVLGETARTVAHASDRHALASTRAILALLAGDPARAVELGRDALCGSDGSAQPIAAAAVAGGLAVQGRTSEALAVVRSGRAGLESAAPGTSAAFARIALAQAEVVALMLGDRFGELDRRTRELHAGAMGTPQGVGDAVSALHRGWAELATGQVRAARSWMGQATAGLQRADPAGLLPLATSQLALLEALLGRTAVARELLADGGSRVTVPLFAPFQMLAEAWVRAAEGGDAGTAALDAAAIAAASGQQAVELLMLHMGARLGCAARAAPRLGELEQQLDGPMPAAMAAHARAVAADDGAALERAADRFEQLGAQLRAADASAQAAEAHERAGHRRPAASAHARAQALALTCEVWYTPALQGLTPTRLTSREEEVARLAAQGKHNQAIAARLVVSVRTVEAHLANAYTKLGITSRRELGRTLVPRAPDRMTYTTPDQPGNIPVTRGS